MLVLSRKEGERLSIGDNITIVVTKVSGNRVTIGIEAPRDVKVVRSELDVAEASAPIAESSEKPATNAGLKIFTNSLRTKQLRNVG